MTTEVKQPSFGDLFQESLKTTGPLFDIKREQEALSLGGAFYCYACTHVKPMKEYARTLGARQYCIGCYPVIKTEPKTKDRGDE